MIGLGSLRALWSGSAPEKKRMGGILSASYLLSASMELISPTHIEIIEEEKIDMMAIIQQPFVPFFEQLRKFDLEGLYHRIPRTFSFWTTVVLAILTAFSVTNFSEHSSEKHTVMFFQSNEETNRRVVEIMNRRIPKVIHVKEEETTFSERAKSRGVFPFMPRWKDFKEK